MHVTSLRGVYRVIKVGVEHTSDSSSDSDDHTNTTLHDAQNTKPPTRARKSCDLYTETAHPQRQNSLSITPLDCDTLCDADDNDELEAKHSVHTDDNDSSLWDRDKARRTDRSPRCDLQNTKNIFCDYFVVKSSASKVSIRVHGKHSVRGIYSALCAGPFGRNAFLSVPIRNGSAIRNAKLQRLLFDAFDHDDTQQIAAHSLLLRVDNLLVFDRSFGDVCDVLRNTRVNLLVFQKAQIRPSRLIRVLCVVRYKILFSVWFQRVILCAIVANTVCLALSNPLRPNAFLARAEYFFFAQPNRAHSQIGPKAQRQICRDERVTAGRDVGKRRIADIAHAH